MLLTIFFYSLGPSISLSWEVEFFGEERMWEKLVTLDTFHWYCDGPKPTLAARRYDAQVRQRKSVALYFGFLVFTLFHSNHSSSFM